MEQHIKTRTAALPLSLFKNLKRFCRGLHFLFFVAGFVLPLQAFAASLPPLFEKAAPPSKEATESIEMATHNRYVKFNSSLFTGFRSRFFKPGFKPSFTLNLFDDVQYTLVVDRPEFKKGDRMTLLGHLQDVAGSYFVLAYQKGMVSGVVIDPQKGSFQIHYAGKGLHHIYADRTSGGAICNVRRSSNGLPPVGIGVPQQGQPAWIPMNYPTGCPYAGTPPILDILVVYTASAMAAEGGTPQAMENTIDAAVAYTNMCYFNSGVTAQMRVVHTEEVDYTESGDENVDLSRLQTPGDGYMDNVQTLRDTYGADLVNLITGTSESGGLAYFAASAGNFYPESAYSMEASNYILPGFAHETGHNLGCDHDLANAVGAGAYSYSYGFSFNGGGIIWGTVMCYPGTQNPFLFQSRRHLPGDRDRNVQRQQRQNHQFGRPRGGELQAHLQRQQPALGFHQLSYRRIGFQQPRNPQCHRRRLRQRRNHHPG